MKLEGIANFRDVGGGSSGIRAGRLFRSGQLSRATAGDARLLRELGITTIVDLRRPAERAARPSPILPAATLSSDLDQAGQSPHLSFLQSGCRDTDAIRAYLLDYYRAAPFTPHNLSLFGQLIGALGAERGPVLVHCVAGKDRTGLAIAIVQLLLGLPRFEILAEFCRSNHILDDPAQIESQRLLLQKLSLPEDHRELIFGVAGRQLKEALHALSDPGVETYLSRLEITSDVLRSAREYLTCERI